LERKSENGKNEAKEEKMGVKTIEVDEKIWQGVVEVAQKEHKDVDELLAEWLAMYRAGYELKPEGMNEEFTVTHLGPIIGRLSRREIYGER
jgi:hypothetical protein